MPMTVDWHEIALRLVLTIVAGGLIGFNREEHGRAAGLCTMILVCLAASVSMILANLMLASDGRHPDSFIMLDLMRLPLGVLSGMGFIGAGAILRRGSAVLGVTTAATLWFVTMMGLCFGAGQHGLGLAMLAAGVGVLWLLKWIEKRIAQDRRGILVLASDSKGPGDGAIREQLSTAGFRIDSCAMTYLSGRQVHRFRYELVWRGRVVDSHVPAVFEQLAKQPGVRRLRWKP
jgi:putative Mg2+ transporter-C (MgtC) family protein